MIKACNIAIDGTITSVIITKNGILHFDTLEDRDKAYDELKGIK